MKQTKRIVVTLLCLLVAMSTIFAMTSCGGNGECEHSNTEWVVVKEATETEAGTKNQICLDCTEIISTETIPATGTADDPTPPTPPTPTPPATPAGLVRNGTVVSWDAVEGATSYVVKIGDATHTVTTTSLDLSALTLTAGTTYEISVQAVNADGSSAFSAVVSFGYLTGEFEISYSNKVVTWEPVEFATSYEVRVNGGEAIALGNATSYTVPAFTAAGDYVIEVRYTDGGNTEWMTLTVTAYTVTYSSGSLSGGDTFEYLATGDAMTIPTGTYTNIGYDFSGWYTAAQGGTACQTGDIFTAENDITVYGGWTARSYTLNLKVEGFGITNIQGGATQSVTYDSNYTLPVPTLETDGADMFLGWFSSANELATRYTDEHGNSVGIARFTETTDIYPVFIPNVLAFELQSDDTYAVYAGANFDKVANITIPVTYQGKAVTTILENAFDSRKLLVSINIPNTIQLVGSGAFNGNVNLKEINVYEVEGNHDVFYSSADGALILSRYGNVTLEVFPRAKTGTFKTPEGVTALRSRVFQNSSISEIIISKDVLEIYERAFHNCNSLKTVTFEGGRTANVTIMCGEDGKKDTIFYATRNIETISLPAMINEFDYSYVFDLLNKLTTINVEEGGDVYSSVDGMFVNGVQDTILYAPLSVKGDYTIPDGIVHIANSAFAGRTGLKSVTIPRHVETIGSSAFSGCTGITSVTVNGGRYVDLSIGSSAFYGCKLNTVTFVGSGDDAKIDKGAITIGASAFAPGGQTTLKTVTFGTGVNVTKIGDNAFSGQSNLANLSFAANIQLAEIGKSAFKSTKITSLNIPATVTKVGDSAFESCTSLESITINEGSSGTIDFGTSVFKSCTKITSVYLPSTVSEFTGTVFDGCTALTKIEVADANPNLESKNGVLYNEAMSTLIYYPRGLGGTQADLDALPWNTITAIGAAAFSGHPTLAAFEIKSGLTSIGQSAFEGCTALKKITLAEGATAASLTIGNKAFSGCTGLWSVSLPAYTTSIGNSAFYKAKFTTLTMPTSLTTIGSSAFAENSFLDTITIPANVTSVGSGAFYKCTSLATVTIADSNTLITFGGGSNSGVFQNCSALKTIDLKNRATNIGSYMFASSGLNNNTGSLDITKVIGTNVTTIGIGAFSSATGIKTMTIPANVTKIDNYAFSGLSNLTTVTIAEGTNGLTFGSYVFQNCSKLTTVNFPARTAQLDGTISSGTSSIYVCNVPELFSGCSKLETITVTAGENNKYVAIDGVLYKAENGDSVPTVLLYCPPANPAKALTVPATVSLVENRSLYNLKNVKTITFENYPTTDTEHYGKQLLWIGRTKNTNDVAGNVSGTTYAAIGGASNALTTLNLPAHLAGFGSYAITATAGKLVMNVDENSRDIAIGSYAFSGAKIVNYKFYGVGALADRSFNGAFNSFDANSTENFTIELGEESSLTLIPSNSLSGGIKIKSFVVPASVVEIGSSAFYTASKLETVSFAKGSKLEVIGGSAFGVCSALTTVDFSNVTKDITFGVQPFQNCTSLTSFTFPENVAAVGSKFFEGCSGLKSVTLSKNFTEAMFYATNSYGYVTTIFGDSSSFSTLALENIFVDEDNPHFISENGVLYNKDKTYIYFYPPAKSAAGYTLPTTITQIGAFAFYKYQGTKLDLPDGLTTIGDGAFRDAAVTSFKIGSNVVNIGNHAFSKGIYNNNALTSVIFEDNIKITKLGDQVFTGNYSLATISNLPDTITTIGKQAFQGTCITSIILPSALTAIGDGMLQNIRTLTSVTIQNNVQSIGEKAFYNCTGLTEIKIPALVMSIGNQAFQGANNLKTVEFAKGSILSRLGKDAFYNCKKLESINLPNSVAEIVESTESAGTTQYASGLFANCTSLKEVNLAGISYLPLRSFKGCTALTKVTFGDSLESIGPEAFQNCSKLTTVEGTANATYIGTNAFQNCSKLEAIDLGNVTEIPAEIKWQTGKNMAGPTYLTITNTGAFKNCASLTEVNLASLESIPANTFENCVNVSKLTLCNDVEYIGNYAFANCDKITKIVIPGSVLTLGDYAFYDCDALATASVTYGLEYFGELAFGSCDVLSGEGYVPETVDTLKGNPYAGCFNVKGLKISDENTYLTRDTDGSIYNANKTTLYYYNSAANPSAFTLPTTVTTIAPGAFSGTNVKSITIPAKVTKVAPYAFFQCPELESVTISEGITEIGRFAFYGCEKLNNVTIPATATTLGDYAFANCSLLSDVTFASATATYTIGTHFFENCAAMTEIKLPAKISGTAIPAYMFAGTGIVNAVIPANITNINTDGVFKNCASLETVTFEAEQLTYSYIGNYMFYNCDSLVTIEIPNGNSANPLANSIGYTFAECDNLETVILYYKPATGSFGSSSTPTSAGMFMNCKSLKEVILYNVSDVIVDDDDNTSDGTGSDDSSDNGASEEGGSGLGTNTGNGSGLGTNTGNGSGLGTNTGSGSDDSSEESSSGLGTNTGNGSGLGTNTGNGSGLGTNTGNGSGLGTNTGSGSDDSSEESGSGLGTNTGNGSGLGTSGGLSAKPTSIPSYLAPNVVASNSTATRFNSTFSAINSGISTYNFSSSNNLGTANGAGSEDSDSDDGVAENSGNGSGLGTSTGSGSSLGTNTGNGSGLGTNTGNGSGLGTNTGSGSDDSSEEGGSGLGTNTGSGSGLGTNTGNGSGLGTNTGNGSGLGTNTGNGSGLGTNTGSGSDDSSEEGGSGLGTNTGNGSGLGTNTGNGSGLGTNTGSGSDDSEDSGNNGSTDNEPADPSAKYNQGYLDYIGKDWFSGCESLEEITIMNNAYIGDNAFEGCTSLKEVNFYDPSANDNNGENNGGSDNSGSDDSSEESGSGLGTNTGNGSGLGTNTGNGSGLGTNTGNGSGLGTNTGNGSGLGTNTGSGSDDSSEESGSGLGTNTGNGSGLGTNTGNGSGLGTNTGNGSGLGTNTGNGSGLGTNTGSGSDDSSEESGSGLGTNTGNGSGLGTNTGNGSGLGTNTGNGSGLGTNTGNGSGLGTNTGNGSGLGTNTGNGSGLGTNTGNGSGLGTNTGNGSGLGTNTGNGSGLGTNTGSGSDDSSEESGSGLGTNTGNGSGLGTNTGNGSGLGTNTGNGSGLGTNTGNGSGLGTNTGNGSGLGTNTGSGSDDSEGAGSGLGGNTGGLGGNTGGLGGNTGGLGGNTGGGSDDSEEEDVPTTPAAPVATLKYLGNNAFKGCTALTTIDLPGIPANAGSNVFEGWTAEQTINLSNTEAELADQAADLFAGCEATVNYKTTEA